MILRSVIIGNNRTHSDDITNKYRDKEERYIHGNTISRNTILSEILEEFYIINNTRYRRRNSKNEIAKTISDRFENRFKSYTGFYESN